jgi:hypothetical protein
MNLQSREDEVRSVMDRMSHANTLRERAEEMNIPMTTLVELITAIKTSIEACQEEYSVCNFFN